MIRHARRAFSLFDLIVVLAIVGFLLAMLLPAVLKVRQASERMQSVNNLKQLGLACHNYLSTFNSFPPGNTDNNFSTAALLLPYIEQNASYNKIDYKKSIDDDANAEARKVKIKTFLSPQDPIASVKDDYGATNYLFNAGSKYALKDNDGVFYQNSKTGVAQLADGFSNTLMAGETLKGDGGTKAVSVQRQHILLKASALTDLDEDSGVTDFKAGKHIAGDRCASWMDGRLLQGTFTAARVGNDERPDVSCDGIGGLAGLRSLTSTFNVLMCDGSVRSIQKKIDQSIWKALATRAGGETTGDF